MSADGAIGQDAIAKQPNPVIKVPLYTEAQWACWPVHLRQAYFEWKEFVSVFREYRETLLRDPNSNPVEVDAITRFIDFAMAPLHGDRNLVVTDPGNAREEFCFAALGPYGDPLLLAELFEDTLTHRSTTHDFRDVVGPYMQFLTHYDPRYWREYDHTIPLDDAVVMEEEYADATMRARRHRDMTHALMATREDLLEMERVMGLSEDEVAQLQHVTVEIRETEHAWRLEHERRRVLDANLQIQTQINEWLRRNRPRRGERAHLQTNAGTIRFPPLSEFN